MTRVDSELTSNGYSNSVVVDFEEETKMKVVPEEVIKKAREAFKSGRSKPLKFRKEQLKALEKFLEECEEEIVKALYQDLRKHRQEVVMCEIDVLKHDLRHTLFNLCKWTKPIKPAKSWINALDGIYVYNDPYGVVLIIGAWNYPLSLLLAPLVGAIAGGNCAILKPSELAPEVENVMVKHLPKYLDKECFHVVTGGVEETTELLTFQFDYIFFTGSTAVGKIVHQAAAKFLTPTTLELGGKSPVYLDDSANILTATRRILWGKCVNSGQTCIAPDYLLCTKEVEEKFLQAAQRLLVEFYGDDGKISPQVCKIVSDRHYKRLMSFIQNSNVALGGISDPRERLISFTVLTDVKVEDAVMEEEIFGPILPIITVDSPQAAIDFINERDKPLALYVFTKRKDVREMFLNGTLSGGLCFNETLMHFCTENLPFGGVGASGMGEYHSKYSFDTFTHKKAVLMKSLGAVVELSQKARYPPYSNFKTDFLSFLVKKRRCISFCWLKWVLVFGLGVGFAYSIQCFSREKRE